MKRRLVPVGQGHSLYCVERGDLVEGPALLFIHGGPGGRLDPTQLDWAVSRCRAIAFDQRGCGRSQPPQEVANNTTTHCVEDIETLRRVLGISSFILVAGSWGSAIAVLYASAFAERVDGLVLYSPFLGSTSETHYFLTRLRHEQPTAWRAFADVAQAETPHEIVERYYHIITGDDRAARGRACRAWVDYEICAATNGRVRGLDDGLVRAGHHLAYATISCNYFRHRFFLTSDVLSENAPNVSAETYILHGTEDLVSTPETAVALACAIPQARLDLIDGEGHCTSGSVLESRVRDLVRDISKGRSVDG